MRECSDLKQRLDHLEGLVSRMADLGMGEPDAEVLRGIELAGKAIELAAEQVWQELRYVETRLLSQAF